MLKDFEMWNYSFLRPHYNCCINFRLKDWSFYHMAGRRIAIDCILTKKKLDGAQWCHCVWGNSPTLLLKLICGMVKLVLHWSQCKFDYLDMHQFEQHDTFWICLSNHLFCRLRRTSRCDIRHWILHLKKEENSVIIYSPSGLFKTTGHFFLGIQRNNFFI